MKRHPSLHPLSEHHHHALVQALQIRRAGLGEAERAAALREAAQAFVRFYRTSGYLHFREEEEILLPAYARHRRLDENPHITRMLAEHALIRSRVEDLERALATSAPVEQRVTELAHLLQGHVRLEEDEVFPHLESVLGEAELNALQQRFTWLHRQSERAQSDEPAGD